MIQKKLWRWGLRTVAASLFALAPLFTASAHNFYASFTQIEWNASDSSIELVMQLHSHELETKLSLTLNERLSFLEDEDLARLEGAAGDFVKNNIALALDGKSVELTFLGLETDNQNILLYLEADWPAPPGEITFMNAVFLDDLPDQVNSVLAIVNGKRLGGDITRGNGPLTFDF